MGDGASSGLRFGVLGPLDVRDGAGAVDPGPYKQRVLLGVLLLRANMVVPVDQLVQAVWPEGLPRTARKNLQVYVSALRKIIGDRIHHASYGYVLDAVPDEVDALRFDTLANSGYAAYHSGNLHETRKLLGEAVALWRDEVLADLAGNPVIAAEADQLGQRYLAVYEDWVDLEIDAGRHLAVLGPLARLARRHPFRERLTAATITALYRAGRRREALATYEVHRQLIARELGIAPSLVLQQLYQSMLADASNRSLTLAPAGRGRVRPAQLPRDVPDLVGRADQVDDLVGALTGPESSDVAVITGAVGTGKTALAVRVGHRVAEAFEDGQVFVSLRVPDGRPKATRDVVTELMRATGLDVPVPRDDGEALAVWRSWIADRAFLVILDSAVSERQVRGLLPGKGRNRTVVTSSHRLSGLESVHRVEVGEISEEEAGELVGRAVGPGRVLGSALRRIIGRCGSTPLVVRAVAAKLDSLRHLSMVDYADRLESAQSVLCELVAGGTPVRERVARVYSDLAPPQRQAVRALGGLPGGPVGAAELAEAFAALPEPATRIIDRLVEANIVGAPDAAHYAVPALVRHFAADLAR
ncbi:Regulatory protein AfsR [Actinokineospora sp. UTMC 2448]|nr:Regulatory protein AfsR [Actinokineospora sp. UTMC 2448]